MKIIEIKFAPWDKDYWFNPQDHKLKVGGFVIVKTEIGVEIGEIIKLKEISEEKIEREIKPIMRKATTSDVDKVKQKNKHAKQDLETCRKLVEKHKLEIKVIGVHYSFDGGRITFAFTASGRIDFRELVKDLTHVFQKSIRLHQIGVRDEAKCHGEVGPCGQTLCCKKFLNKLGQVNSEFVVAQQIMHRGSERLTGICGRLKCCLKYENEMYEELNKGLPKVGDVIKTKQGKGRVISINSLQQKVKVELLDKDTKTVIDIKF